MENQEHRSAQFLNVSDQAHIRLLSTQLDEQYQAMKVERSAIAHWEEDQEFSILGVLELFSTEIQGYAERVMLNNSKALLDSSSLIHLRQLNVFNVDYFTDWYFNHFSLYPQIQHYVEQLDHLRLLLIEHLNQRSLCVLHN